MSERYVQEYIKISRPDEAMPALFDNEIYTYHRGFTFGMYGSQKIKTGGGKSIAVAAMCKEYDPSFTVDRIVFSPADFLTQIAEIEKRKQIGAMIVCEEMQNYASNRTWFSIYNKMIMHTIATMRHLRCGAFFVTPMEKMIDGDVRKLMRFGATSRIQNVHGLRGYMKPYEVVTYNNDKDIWHNPITVYDETTGTVIEIDELRVYYPERNFVRELEHKIDEYKSQYRMSLQEEAEAFQDAEKLVTRKNGILSAKNLAEEMLKDSSIIRELDMKGKIQSAAVLARFPNIRDNRTVTQIKYWVDTIWQDAKGTKSTKEFLSDASEDRVSFDL